MKRLFIGLPLSGDARTRGEAILERLRTDVVHQAVRWVRPEKLHVTLVFLGAVEEDQIAVIEAACRRIVCDATEIALTTTTLGAFPDLRRPRVVWLGVENTEALRQLQQNLVQALSHLVALEDRAFHPHVTLGRVSPGSPAVGRMVQAIAESEPPLAARWQAHDVSLYESTPDGRYETLATFSLSERS